MSKFKGDICKNSFYLFLSSSLVPLHAFALFYLRTPLKYLYYNRVRIKLYLVYPWLNITLVNNFLL